MLYEEIAKELQKEIENIKNSLHMVEVQIIIVTEKA